MRTACIRRCAQRDSRSRMVFQPVKKVSREIENVVQFLDNATSVFSFELVKRLLNRVGVLQIVCHSSAFTRRFRSAPSFPRGWSFDQVQRLRSPARFLPARPASGSALWCLATPHEWTRSGYCNLRNLIKLFQKTLGNLDIKLHHLVVIPVVSGRISTHTLWYAGGTERTVAQSATDQTSGSRS